MIGLLVTLWCMYRFIFTDWALCREQAVMLMFAIGIEGIIEAVIGLYLTTKKGR